MSNENTTIQQKNNAEQQKLHLRLEAAAIAVREQILLRLGEATGREMSEQIAQAVLEAADAIMPPLRIEHCEPKPFLIDEDEDA